MKNLHLVVNGYGHYEGQSVELEVVKISADNYYTKPSHIHRIIPSRLSKLEVKQDLVQWSRFNGTRRFTGPQEDDYNFYRAVTVLEKDKLNIKVKKKTVIPFE